MHEPLLTYYQRELLFIRQLLQEFAQQYPNAAKRLMLEQVRSTDAHVERLIESFAILAGRVHQKLDDEFPEITDALLNLLYPHYLAPIPSMAIVQLELDPARGQLPNGFVIPRGSRMQSRMPGAPPLKFRTAYPLTLWPVKLAEAKLSSPPFPPDLTILPGTAALLRLRIECVGGVKFPELSLESLRFFINLDPHLIPVLYELLFHHAIAAIFRPVDSEKTPASFRMAPSQCLRQVGFGEDEGLLPYPLHGTTGYHLLTEFFTFPAKFHFFDLLGFQEVRRRGFQRAFEVLIFVKETNKRLEQVISASNFALGCTPIVNLFEHNAEPIHIENHPSPYRIITDSVQKDQMEVYSVDTVTNVDPSTNRTTEYPPFYSIRHENASDPQALFWFTSRRQTVAEDRSRSEVYLHLVDGNFQPPQLPAGTLQLRITCSNGTLPAQAMDQEQKVRYELEAAAPLKNIRGMRRPTIPLNPPARRGRAWRLISHLNLNYLSLVDGADAMEALKEILRLYDYSDPGIGPQHLETDARQLIEGINSLATRRIVGRTDGGYGRGLEVLLDLDEDKFIATGAYLFGSVLDRLFCRYISANSFCQLTIRTLKKGDKMRWPPRKGELPPA